MERPCQRVHVFLILISPAKLLSVEFAKLTPLPVDERAGLPTPLPSSVSLLEQSGQERLNMLGN